jgi:hypothetical protein
VLSRRERARSARAVEPLLMSHLRPTIGQGRVKARWFATKPSHRAKLPVYSRRRFRREEAAFVPKRMISFDL